MSTIGQFVALLNAHGSDVRFHRGESLTPCPCLTPEGYRDPEWHDANPTAPVCDESGMLPDPLRDVDVIIKGFVQPIQSTRATRLSTEFLTTMFGEIRADDHLGIFPASWGDTLIDFENWSQAGEDFIEYNDARFQSVNANLIPDPSDGQPRHHWEVALRLMGTRDG